jgi:hypothetical protein
MTTGYHFYQQEQHQFGGGSKSAPPAPAPAPAPPPPPDVQNKPEAGDAVDAERKKRESQVRSTLTDSPDNDLLTTKKGSTLA